MPLLPHLGGFFVMHKTLKKGIIIVLSFIFVLATMNAIIVYHDVLFRDKGDIDNDKPENAISILFIGNSHVITGNIPRQLLTLLRMHGVEIAYKDISVFGAPLSRTRDDAIQEMQNIQYDYVVIQDRGTEPQNDIEGFNTNIRILSDEARRNGAVPVLYNHAWVNINGEPNEARLSICTRAYKRAAEENDAILVNAADAWIYAYQTLPGISLYKNNIFDRMHANDAGAFLTACVFAATLFGLQIEDIPNDNRYSGRYASDLTQVAWAFVNSSH
jgi:hypothetical protein